jgi:hypothetical protein
MDGIAQSGYKLGCRIGDHGIRGSVPCSSRDVPPLHSLEPAYSGFHPSSYLGLQLITHLYMLLRLRLHGPILSFLHTSYWHSA